MSGIKKKMSAKVTEDTRLYLRQISKAALADVVCDLVALIEGHADDPPSLLALREACEPRLIARGDRLPRLDRQRRGPKLRPYDQSLWKGSAA